MKILTELDPLSRPASTAAAVADRGASTAPHAPALVGRGLPPSKRFANSIVAKKAARKRVRRQACARCASLGTLQAGVTAAASGPRGRAWLAPPPVRSWRTRLAPIALASSLRFGQCTFVSADGSIERSAGGGIDRRSSQNASASSTVHFSRTMSRQRLKARWRPRSAGTCAARATRSRLRLVGASSCLR